MPNVGELITQANLQVDDTYDNSQYYTWFQEMLDDIANVLFLPKKVSISIGGSGFFQLPTGIKEILAVKTPTMTLPRVALGSTVAIGYYTLGRELYLSGGLTDTTIDVIYDSTPDRLVKSPTYTPNIPERYHRLFVTFACKQAMLLEDEVAYEERYRAYQTEYLAGKSEMERFKDQERSNSTRSSASAWVVIR